MSSSKVVRRSSKANSNHDAVGAALKRELEVEYANMVYTQYSELKVEYRVFADIRLKISRGDMMVWGEFETMHGAPNSPIGGVKREDLVDPSEPLDPGTQPIY
jgi:hypothetical protein